MSSNVKEITEAAGKLYHSGFVFAGRCNCVSRAMKYKYGRYVIKIYPLLTKARLFFGNQTIIGYEPLDKIEKLIERAQETEISA